MKQFRGGLVFEAHRPFYHSTRGSRVIKTKKKCARLRRSGWAGWWVGVEKCEAVPRRARIQGSWRCASLNSKLERNKAEEEGWGWSCGGTGPVGETGWPSGSWSVLDAPLSRSWRCSPVGIWALQGYLAHKTLPPPPLGLPLGPRNRPTVGSEGSAVSYERGTPVRTPKGPKRMHTLRATIPLRP